MERNELEELLEIREDLEMIIVMLVVPSERDVPSAVDSASQALNTVNKMIERKRPPIPDVGDWVDADLDNFITNQE
jgi:hypothetical protein